MSNRSIAVLALVFAITSCSKHEPVATPEPKEAGELLRVGSIVIYQSDLDHLLADKHGGRSDDATRDQALAELAGRASYAQAALDAGLDRDPVVRAETARVLASRLKETELFPKLKAAAAAAIPEARLREIYESQSARFAANEKRQLAVLWLDPGPDPARVEMYTEKLEKGREWLLNESDLSAHPDQGFSVLSVDHSEHAATRFKGGVLGWLEAAGGSTDWDRAVAEIGFSIGEVGGVSAVTTRPEGIFLVRLMAVKPAVQRPFEAVRAELERAERDRLRQQMEDEFSQTIESAYKP